MDKKDIKQAKRIILSGLTKQEKNNKNSCKYCNFGTPELKNGLCRNCLRAFRENKIRVD